jgi:[FeFe] hydrogenase H-cluster maturation GTPase HydF
MARESRPHIGIYGRRNNGKSSFINMLAGQDVSIVSDIAGTTTDPVKKSIEIHGLGPVIVIDTAGIDDSGTLGEKRIKKTIQSIQNIDLAILIISENNFANPEHELIQHFTKHEVPFFIIHNKSDIDQLKESLKIDLIKIYNIKIISCSIFDPASTERTIEMVKLFLPENAWKKGSMLGDFLSQGDIVLLITPIDNEAPEGRLILPQVQAIRDILDNDCVAIVVKEKEADAFLRNTQIKPKLAVTDSSIFLKADAIVPKDVPLTGFSILLARYKGPFQNFLHGTPHITKLKDGDKILLLESCTHQVSCDDIGRVKIPRWLNQFTGKKLHYDIVSGLGSLPDKINNYALVIQCGGCMITQRQVYGRLKIAIDAGVPVTNYGLTIAYLQGIYNRAIEPFVGKNDSTDYL